MPQTLHFGHTTVTGPGWPVLARVLEEHALPVLAEHGGRPYGLFAPQFGLGSDQLVWMTAWEGAGKAGPGVERALSALPEVSGFEHRSLVSTARPKQQRPPERPGVYVHRWFELDDGHVDEVVALSAEAWESFEATFEVEVIGFFLEPGDAGRPTTLMLLNWYPSLAAWESSREFDRDPASRDRFRRRAELTKRTWAITTSLVGAR